MECRMRIEEPSRRSIGRLILDKLSLCFLSTFPLLHGDTISVSAVALALAHQTSKPTRMNGAVQQGTVELGRSAEIHKPGMSADHCKRRQGHLRGFTLP
mmetsp:Transcript_76446/g.151252  ORF Transcript_76446/g.151252 Transcript_76446/m.151252 type:complete len:99 (+) Transcript_76446:725-1021(+)